MGRRRLDVVIVSPRVSQIHHVPAGMVYVDEILSQARLFDKLSQEEGERLWLAECLDVLNRRFGRQVRVRVVDPMTLSGLYFVVRHRLRSFPAVVFPDGRAHFRPSAEEFATMVADLIQGAKESH